MAFEMRNFAIDRPKRGIGFHTSTREKLWEINNLENTSLKVASESKEIVDAIGVRIMELQRAKNAEFSGESTFIDYGLLAAQGGSQMNVASNTNKFRAPIFDEATVTEAGKLTLQRTPVARVGDQYACNFLYKINGDGSLGQRFEAAAAAAAGKYSIAGKNVTFDSTDGVKPGDEFFAYYEYEVSGAANSGAVEIKNSATQFPDPCEFVMEVIGRDLCSPTTKYFAYVVFPNALLSCDFDVSFGSDSKHPFTLKAMQEYCSREKLLYRIVIPELAVAA